MGHGIEGGPMTRLIVKIRTRRQLAWLERYLSAVSA